MPNAGIPILSGTMNGSWRKQNTCSAEGRILPLNADQHARSSPTGTGGIVDTRQHLLSQGVAIQARPDLVDWQPAECRMFFGGGEATAGRVTVASPDMIKYPPVIFAYEREFASSN